MNALKAINESSYFGGYVACIRSRQCDVGINVDSKNCQPTKEAELVVEERRVCTGVELKGLVVESLEAADSTVVVVTRNLVDLIVSKKTPEVVVAEVVV